MTMQPRNLGPLAYALTRIANRVTGGALSGVLFAPGQPLQPVTQEQTPRQMQYPVAVNMLPQPRRDFPGLTPFEELRYLCKRHPLASLCIRVRCEQIALLPWRVVAKDKKQQAALQQDCDALEAFFAKPDGVTPLTSWLQMFVRDLLEIDAPVIYRQPDRSGRLSALRVIDGATIKPVIDDFGMPIAYQQVIYGLQLSQYKGRRVAPDEEEVIGEYGAGEIWYLPYNPSTGTPYGRPPMEDLLELAKIYLQKLGYDLAHFTEGNIPAALAYFKESTGLDVGQVLEFEQNFNAVLQGDQARGSRLKFIPFPVSVERMSQLSTGGAYESAWEEHNVKLVTANYGTTPAEVGFTADVNRSTSEGQENITYRRLRPMTQWLKLNVFDPVIQRDFGYTALEIQPDFGESEDRLMTAQVDQIYAGIGSVSGAELRTMRYPDLGGAAPVAPALPTAKLLEAPLVKAKGDDEPEDKAERDAAETAMLGLLSGYFAAQLKRLRAALKDGQPSATIPAALGSAAQELRRAVLPFYQTTASLAAESAMRQLAIGVDWDLVNDAVLTLAKDEAARLAEQVSDTTKAQAAKIVADWIETGGTLDELAESLERLYPEPRAKMIAATEVTRLYAAGNRAAWQASGVVKAVEIRTAEDDKVCPICGPKADTQVALDSADVPPFHVRCRCWLVPVVMDAEEIAAR